MNQLPLFDVAVIGGGLGGLTAAIYAARAGRSVIVFEKSPQAGGRASTQNVDGFHFNQGPHALYRGGHGIPILRELGISYEGAKASYDGSWAVRDGEKHPLPGTPEALLSTPLLTEVSRRMKMFEIYSKACFGWRHIARTRKCRAQAQLWSR
jgi:phytoene dehydrogenase-like protein